MRIKREQSMYQLICSDNVNTLLQKRGGEWGKYMQKFLIGLSDRSSVRESETHLDLSPESEGPESRPTPTGETRQREQTPSRAPWARACSSVWPQLAVSLQFRGWWVPESWGGPSLPLW